MFTPKPASRLALLAIFAVLTGACSASSGGSGGTDPNRNTGGTPSTGGRSGSGGSPAGSGGSTATGTGGGTTTGTGGTTTTGTGGTTAGTGGTSTGAGGSTSDTAAPADTAAPSDVAAPTDTTPGTMGPLPPAVRKVVILHAVNAGGSANDPSRKSMVDLLMSMKDSHGIVVEMADSPTKAADLMDKALIIVGPNASMFGANHPDPGLKTIPVPLMVSKDGNTTEIGLGKVGATDPPNFNKINIINTDHPLAAGLAMGSITVLTTPASQRIITFAGIGPDAIKIATGPQSATTYAIIGYDKGGDMGGGVKAPARRVGFFWHRPAAATPEGGKLFKAAVDWLLR